MKTIPKVGAQCKVDECLCTIVSIEGGRIATVPGTVDPEQWVPATRVSWHDASEICAVGTQI